MCSHLPLSSTCATIKTDTELMRWACGPFLAAPPAGVGSVFLFSYESLGTLYPNQKQQKDVLLLAKRDSAKSKWDTADQVIRELIALLLLRSGMSYYDLSTRLGMTDRTLRTRRLHPETFTLLELRRLRALGEKYGLEIDLH